MVEAKAVADGPTKADICVFDRKTFDLYMARMRAGQAGAHHRILVSSTPVREDLLRYCYLYGILCVDPLLLPLPLLLGMAARPAADLFFDPVLLSELVRLGEPACAPLETRYAPKGDSMRISLHEPSAKDLEDLTWIHRVLSDEVLEVLDIELPGYFEDRAERLLSSMSGGVWAHRGWN
ncbi:hypothetical protein D7Y23_33255 [Corallococcus sp. AB050B]|nr:hypothetical protein D7Y23_33255 [Corallococcus sp. AB050B]